MLCLWFVKTQGVISEVLNSSSAHSACWKFIWFPSACTWVHLMWVLLEFLGFVKRFCSLKLQFCALNWLFFLATTTHGCCVWEDENSETLQGSSSPSYLSCCLQPYWRLSPWSSSHQLHPSSSAKLTRVAKNFIRVHSIPNLWFNQYNWFLCIPFLIRKTAQEKRALYKTVSTLLILTLWNSLWSNFQ